MCETFQQAGEDSNQVDALGFNDADLRNQVVVRNFSLRWRVYSSDKARSYTSQNEELFGLDAPPPIE